MPEQRIKFRVENGRVSHENLSVKIGDATISTSGGVYLNGSLQLLATMPIPDDWADKSPYLAGLKGQSLKFPVDGSLTDPSVDTRLLGQLGGETVQNAAMGLLNQGLNRGLEKLLGNPTAQPQGQTQSTEQDSDQNSPNNSPEKAILGIGEQIFRGQGIKLPGLFGNPQSGDSSGNTNRGN